MNKYVQQAGKDAFAHALMNPSENSEDPTPSKGTNQALWFLHTTKSDPTFVIHVEDDKPALFLFLKYHKAHPSGTTKDQVFQLLKDRTPPDILYMGRSMTDWKIYFEEFLGPISCS